jgi:ribosomal protein L35AE/L33A
MPASKKVYVKVVRQHGADGIIKCKFETQVVSLAGKDHTA